MTKKTVSLSGMGVSLNSLSRKKELKEEREYLNGIAEALEAYLQVCYEEVNDHDLCLKFTKYPRIISMIKRQELLKGLAAKIYVYASILRDTDHEITFDTEREIFKVKVIHYDYPF